MGNPSMSIGIKEKKMKKLILMRGIPGSGKSTLAKELAKQAPNSKIYSTDDLFMVDGVYKFKPSKLGKFHKENQKRADDAMTKGVELVIIDNTNTTLWEMKPYIKSAKKHGYEIECAIPQTEWAFDAEICFEKNTHGVPLDVIRKMIARFQKIEDIATAI